MQFGRHRSTMKNNIKTNNSALHFMKVESLPLEAANKNKNLFQYYCDFLRTFIFN